MKFRIKEVMREKGISSISLAEKTHVSKATISNLINNKTTPSMATLDNIADAIGVPLWQLFTSPEQIEEQVEKNYIECPVCHTRFKMTKIS